VAGRPAFLATGDQDTIVGPKNTMSLAAKLHAAGVPVEQQIYPGLDHADTLLALSRRSATKRRNSPR
jgi:acetyl esterase/lipase